MVFTFLLGKTYWLSLINKTAATPQTCFGLMKVLNLATESFIFSFQIVWRFHLQWNLQHLFLHHENTYWPSRVRSRAGMCCTAKSLESSTHRNYWPNTRVCLYSFTLSNEPRAFHSFAFVNKLCAASEMCPMCFYIFVYISRRSISMHTHTHAETPVWVNRDRKANTAVSSGAGAFTLVSTRHSRSLGPLTAVQFKLGAAVNLQSEPTMLTKLNSGFERALSLSSFLAWKRG